MNLRTDSTIAISVISAVALWAVATLLERRLAETAGPVPASAPAAAAAVPGSDGAPAGQAEGCTETEQALRDVVAGSQSCSTDEDCTIFDYGYPIECMTSINKDRIPAIRQSYAVYEQRCEYRVYYDCPSEPLVRVPLCRANHCVVELQTVETLKDATLEHIGTRRGRVAPGTGR